MIAALLTRWRGVATHARSSSWGMAEYFAYPLLMFIATPVFLHQLGSAQYGQWMLLLAFNGIGGVAGLGMGTAVVREVAMHRARGDLGGAAHAVRVSLALTLASSLTLASIILGIGLIAADTLLARMGSVSDIHHIIIFAAVLITLEQVDTVFAGGIRGMERFDVSAKLEISTKFAIVLVSVALALATAQLFPVLIAVVALTVARASAKAVLCARLLGSGRLLPRWDPKMAREALSFGKWVWLQSLGSAMFSTADRLIVGSLLGAEPLARYSVCLQLAQQVQAIPAAGAVFMFPMISRKRAAGQDTQRVAMLGTLIFAAIGAAIATPLILFAHPLLSLWVGPTVAATSAPVLVFLAFGFVLLAVNIGPHFVLLGEGAAGYVAGSNIAAGMVAVALAVALVGSMGLIGAAIARIGYAVVLCSNLVSMAHVLRARRPGGRMV